jgi:hypothetical protein
MSVDALTAVSCQPPTVTTTTRTGGFNMARKLVLIGGLMLALGGLSAGIAIAAGVGGGDD